ncbi:glycoside hydrolase family 18 protein [Thozetella sp. PMI_491]|nr:glycoside hydrolase family 18 protein [Thozetella sp. PMI_491]
MARNVSLSFKRIGASAVAVTRPPLYIMEGASGWGSHLRQPAGVSYRARNDCPALCSSSGPNPANWTTYHNLDQLSSCKETVFYHFSIHDDVDDNTSPHRIYACTSYGAPQKPGVVVPADKEAVQTLESAPFALGSWNGSATKGVNMVALSRQMRLLLGAGYVADDNAPLILFAQSVSGTVGLYMGKSVRIQATASTALPAMENALYTSNSTGGSAAMQLCGPGYDADHIFVRQPLQSWANATCLAFDTAQNVTSTASFTTPLVASSNATINGTSTAYTASRVRRAIRGSNLERRDDCTTKQVISGDSCASLATKCGISAADFTKYNPSSTLCSMLTPGWHVCCSDGTLPDFKPKPNDDGSCSTYTIHADDTCAGLAAANDLINDDIEDFNKNTWAWNGCNLLYTGNIICLSNGTPPMPAPLANAQCGPQKPGTTVPAGGTVNISGLNPYPLNACCDVWGQCGITAEFCTDTNTGAPGIAEPNTNGCISNCGTDIVKSGAPSEWISLAYYEGFGMDRPCLYQDVRQIDSSKFSHVHFAFGVLNADYSVSTGDPYSTYEFNAFLGLTDIKRVVSFGGWSFSTDPSTYTIFRTGVTAANRLTMATNIANFVKDHDLDGEPDIPGIPAGSDDDGSNHLAFLVVLKNLLPGKTVSIAAPASYWYLKQFPIADISKVVDYIVFMTYDLHGQWDAGNSYSQEGCSNGMCLRSHINLTETNTALAMITKAGVASNKVVVGVSSYGRSFNMAEAGCYGADCLYTGTAAQSDAQKGLCTNTAGYISDAEINDIVINNASRINQNFLDAESHSRIVVYDSTQWVAFMDPDILAERQKLYARLEMGGITNWASDLESYNDAPEISGSCRNGNWTSVTCHDPSVENIKGLAQDERWNQMDGPDAWTDVINVWKQYDKGHTTFTMSVSNTIHGPEQANCGTLLSTKNCDQTLQCVGFQGGGSDAAGYEIWNSMVIIHEMYASYQPALTQAAATVLDPALADFENNFAPVPPPPDDTWLEFLLIGVSLVGTVAVSAFFNGFLKALPYFERNKVTYDNSKDVAKAFVSFGVSMASALTGKGSDGSGWTAQKQAAFSDYMGQAVTAWGNISEESLKNLFSGSDESINLLTTMISNGHLIEGSVDGGASFPTADVAKGFFAYAIATVWPLAGTHAFILDSGYGCGTVDPATEFLTTDVMHQTAGCYNGKLYYLVYPKDDAKTCTDVCDKSCQTSCTHSKFSAPPGISTLDGSRFGGVTVSDLITGSVRTYIQNGNANGGAATDPTNGGSLNDLMDADITTPGFIRLPVCSGDMAWTAWSIVSDKSVPNWPCYVKPSISDCSASTFVDQTSDASPSVDDCKVIITNIQNTQGEWEVENAVESQHQIVQYGSCKFGVQGKSINGNIDFHIGAQDIVDIITDAINQFGGSGKIGAKGEMSCKGDVSTVPVEWGLY